MKKEVLPDETPSGTQGFFINTRRDKFKDPRVREALALAFDFEWTNRNMFYGLYDRTQSFFENSPMEAEGEPSDAERALIESLGVEVPEGALEPAVMPPESGRLGPGPKAPARSGQAPGRGRLAGQDGKRVNDRASSSRWNS